MFGEVRCARATVIAFLAVGFIAAGSSGAGSRMPLRMRRRRSSPAGLIRRAWMTPAAEEFGELAVARPWKWESRELLRPFR
jgi:hypothetical protein